MDELPPLHAWVASFGRRAVERHAAGRPGAAAAAAPAAGPSAASLQPSSHHQATSAVSQERLQISDAEICERGAVIGVNLRSMREERRRAGQPVEHYNLTHAHQLELYTSRKPFHSSRDRVYCKDIHGDGCKQCASCHFCRQKVVTELTSCFKCRDSRGMWCGKCLQLRIGENMYELPPNWVCPVCRDICNCSAANCIRRKHDWGTTGQLATEAISLSYKSVAHYLIYTSIYEQRHLGGAVLQARSALPATAPRRQPEQRKRQREEPEAVQLQPQVARRVQALIEELGLVPDPSQPGLSSPGGLPGLPPAGGAAAGPSTFPGMQFLDAPGGAWLGSPGGEGAAGAAAEPQQPSIADALARDLAGESEASSSVLSAGPRGWRQRLEARKAARQSPAAAALAAPAAAPAAAAPRVAQHASRVAPARAAPAPESRPAPAARAALVVPNAPAGSGGPGWRSPSPSIAMGRPSGHFQPLPYLPPRRSATPAQQAQQAPAPVPPAGPAPVGPWGPGPSPLNPAAAGLGGPPVSRAAPPAEAGAAAGRGQEGSWEPSAAPDVSAAAQPGVDDVRQQRAMQLEALLHRDDGGEAFHGGLPGFAAGPSRAPRRQPDPSAPALPPSGPQRAQHERQQAQQARITPHLPRHGLPAAAPPAQGAAAAAAAMQPPAPRRASPAEPKEPRGGSEGVGAAEMAIDTPLAVAVPSSQLGLSAEAGAEEEPAPEQPDGPGSSKRARTSSAATGEVEARPAASLPAPSAGHDGSVRATPSVRPSPSLPASLPLSGAAALQPSATVRQPSAGATAATAASAPPAPAPSAAASPAGPADARVWQEMCDALDRVLHEAWAMQRDYDPEAPGYQRLLWIEDPYRFYNQQLTEAKSRLEGLLTKAEGMLGSLQQSVAITAANPQEAAAAEDGRRYLFSLAGLRKCLEFYTRMADALEPGDTPATSLHFTIIRRLLEQEPFAAFECREGLAGELLDGCELAARALLLRAWFRLLRALHRKGLGRVAIDQVVSKIRGAVLKLAGELRLGCAVAEAIRRNYSEELEQLLAPSEGRIGPTWRHNPHKPLGHLLQELGMDVIYATSLLLVDTLKQIASACCHTGLGLAAAGFLTTDFVDALLSPRFALGSTEVRIEALKVVCTVLRCASYFGTQSHLDLTTNQIQELKNVQEELCKVVQGDAVGAIEGLVHQENPQWGPGGCSARSAGQEAACEAPGLDKVEALALCYGFLLSHGRMAWEELERKLYRPYQTAMFWQLSGARYRHMAVVILSGVLAMAPDTLNNYGRTGGLLRVWLASLLERQRHSTQHLTRTLATRGRTAALFNGVGLEEIEYVANDNSGDVCAALAATVVENMAADPAWRAQRQRMLEGLDQVLERRSKDIQDECEGSYDPLRRWQLRTATVLLAMLSAGPVPFNIPGRPPVSPLLAASLKALPERVAQWCVAACTLQRREEAEAKALAQAQGEPPPPCKDLAEVRLQLKATVLSQMGDLWALLDEDWGRHAPGGLASDPQLLKPLWIVVSSFCEWCSGSLEPAPVEVVALELLAQSLAPMERHPLARYVLSTFVRRYLERACIPHVSNERAAVNALRFVQELFKEASMRSVGPAVAALRPLLRPLLEALHPPHNSSPSLATKEALYTALASIFESLPTLVPPYGQQQRQQQQQGGSQEQQQQLTPWQAELLRSFLQAVLHDVLRCVRAAAALAAPANAPGKPDSKLEQVRGMASKPLLPPSDAEWAALSNSVFSVQQQLGESVAPLESVNSLYQSHAVHAVWEGEGGGGPTAGGGRPPQPVPARPFRPPDFSWGVAKHAVQLLQMLAALPEAAGVQWAMAAFPAVHVLVVGVPCRQLLGAYQALRKALEAARGVKAIAGFKLPPWWQQQQQQQQQPGAVPAPGAQQQPAAAGVQQQQRQQQQQQGAPAPAQAVAGQQPLPPAQAAPMLSVATVTASVLTSRPAAKPGAQAAPPARQPLQPRPTQEATTQRLPSAMVPTGLLLTQQSHLQGSVQQERPRQPPPVQQPAAAARPAGELGAGPRAGGGGPQPLPSRAADSSSKRRPADSREADSSSKRARAGGTRPLSLLDSLELKAVVDVLGLLSTRATEHPAPGGKGVVVLLELKDFSGPGGAAQRCRVMVGPTHLPVHRAELSRFRDDFEDPKAPGSSLVVLRLTRLELKQHTKDNSVPPVLFCTGHSFLEELPPSHPAAAQLASAHSSYYKATGRRSQQQQEQQTEGQDGALSQPAAGPGSLAMQTQASQAAGLHGPPA